MKASFTSPSVERRARSSTRFLAAALLLLFSASGIAGAGHGGGHAGGHHGRGHAGHGAHHGHGFSGLGGWYWSPYYRPYCNRYGADYDSRRCSGNYLFYDDRSAPYLYVPGGSAVPQGIYGSVAAAPWIGNDNERQAPSVVPSTSSGFSVLAPLLSSSEAPESLPETTRVGAGEPAPEPASGS